MLIESIEFLGFGSIVGEKITFDNNKLNLVVEPNEHGKSTMAEAVWAILYGFSGHHAQEEKESFKPWQTEAPYAGSLELTLQDRPIKIIRDFEEDRVQVIDRETSEDITSEFIAEGEDAQLGYKLTGMTKDLFINTCLVGQRHLDEHHAGGNAQLKNDLKSMADSSTPGATSATATDIIQNTISNFPYGQGTMPVDQVIIDLEEQKKSQLLKLQEMDTQKSSIESILREIADIEQQLSGQSAGSAEAEFNNLKLERMDLEEKTAVFQDRKGNRDKIEQRLLEISTLTPLADDTLANLEELWTRRESRVQDLLSLGQNVRPGQEEYERIEQELNQNYPNFDQIQEEEGNTISTLAISLYNLRRELDNDRMQLQQTTGTRLSNLSSDEGIELPGRVGKSLSEEELEEARSYASLMVAFREQLQDSEKRLQEAEFSRTDIEEKQKANRIGNFGKGLGLGLLSVTCFVIPKIVEANDLEIPQLITGPILIVGLLTLVAFFFFVSKAINYKSFMLEDLERAQGEELKVKKVLQQSKGKVANLENTLSNYAQKAGLETRLELDEYLRKASSEEELHDEQVSKENSIKTKEQQTVKLENDLAYYFKKVGRDEETIDSQRAMDLAQDVKQFYEERNRLEEQYSEIRNSRKQMDFLEEELRDIEDRIKPILDVAGLDQVVELDEHTDEIEKLVTIIREKRDLNEELSKLDYDMAGYESVVSSNTQLQVQINKIDERLKELIDLNPELADCPDPDPNNPPTAVLPWGATEGDKEELRTRKEDLLVNLRTTVTSRDNSYLDTTEEISRLEHEIVCAKRAKLALELAKQKLEESSTKTYESWSNKLNESARELIAELDSEFEALEFDNELNITIRLKGHQEPLSSREIKTKLSTGVKEQIHWLARMALSRFLSKRDPLPIVLDEPFSEADDTRFLNVMKFLLNEGISNNQVILLSCHQQRHKWLESQLSLDEKERLNFVQKEEAGSYNEVSNPA